MLNWISYTGTTPGKKRDRLLLLYEYLDQLGLSEEVEQVTYHGSTSSADPRDRSNFERHNREDEQGGSSWGFSPSR